MLGLLGKGVSFIGMRRLYEDALGCNRGSAQIVADGKLAVKNVTGQRRGFQVSGLPPDGLPPMGPLKDSVYLRRNPARRRPRRAF